MTEAIAIILAVGLLLPLLTSIVQQPRWSKRTRTILSVAVSIVAGVVTYVTANGLHLVPDQPSTIVVFIVGVILASATAYKTVWKPSGVSPAVERVTSKPLAPSPSPEANGVNSYEVEDEDNPQKPYNL